MILLKVIGKGSEAFDNLSEIGKLVIKFSIIDLTFILSLAQIFCIQRTRSTNTKNNWGK